ncbi:MAG: hypothetical protein J07HX5_02036 [halophilic archaeon J07HX5]|jgi:hypothetical protein|nr:MAG: hypothetical protein J07HX5_02036 [halophilic archaeon J07HX5]
MSPVLNVSVAAAHEGDENPVEMLSGAEKYQLANEMTRTDEFHALLQKARELGYNYRPGLEYIDAGQVEAQDWQREVVAIELVGSDDGVRTGIILGRNLGEDGLTIS